MMVKMGFAGYLEEKERKLRTRIYEYRGNPPKHKVYQAQMRLLKEIIKNFNEW